MCRHSCCNDSAGLASTTRSVWYATRTVGSDGHSPSGEDSMPGYVRIHTDAQGETHFSEPGLTAMCHLD